MVIWIFRLHKVVRACLSHHVDIELSVWLGMLERIRAMLKAPLYAEESTPKRSKSDPDRTAHLLDNLLQRHSERDRTKFGVEER